MRNGNGRKHKNRTHGFTQIPNAISFDENLSMKGFGLLMKLLILSEIDDWEFSEMGLVKNTGWGRTTVRSALKELEELGYLVRTQPREGAGRFGKVEWHIFESPIKVSQTGEVTEIECELPNAFEMPNFGDKQVLSSTAPELGYPMSQNQTSGVTTSEHRTQYNTITIKDFNDIKHNNLQCGAGAPGAFATEDGLNNETGGLGEALAESSPSVSTPPVPAQSETALSETDRVLKQLKKKYKSAFVDYALELSQDKDDSIAYMKSVLRDWKKQNLKSIQEVQRYVSSFEDEKTPDLTIKSYVAGRVIRRYEQTPDWLGQEQKHYDANRQLSAEEQQAVDRMKQMQSDLLDQYAANLPF